MAPNAHREAEALLGGWVEQGWTGSSKVPPPPSCNCSTPPASYKQNLRQQGAEPPEAHTRAGAGQPSPSPPRVEHTPSPGSATPLNTPHRNAYTSAPKSKEEHSGQHL